MKKLLTSLLALSVMSFMTGAVFACGPDCKCGCNEGKPCTCKKEAPAEVNNAKEAQAPAAEANVEKTTQEAVTTEAATEPKAETTEVKEDTAETNTEAAKPECKCNENCGCEKNCNCEENCKCKDKVKKSKFSFKNIKTKAKAAETEAINKKEATEKEIEKTVEEVKEQVKEEVVVPVSNEVKEVKDAVGETKTQTVIELAPVDKTVETKNEAIEIK